jgi:6-pyruvoyl-tetrahydropterin synthase
MYETGAVRHVLAWHVMPGMPPPEGERHSHDYRIEATVRCAELDDRGMGVDLDVLQAALVATANTVRDADLEGVVADKGTAITVEVFARWVHRRIAEALNNGASGGELAVRVWESPSAFGGYGAPLRESA